MAGMVSRSRVYKDRMWDEEGREWQGALATWASAEPHGRFFLSKADYRHSSAP